MSLFNKTRAGSTRTVNHEDAMAFALPPDIDLYATVLTTTLGDSFYETSDERITRIRSLILQNDPQFVARLGVYAREKMNLRSVPVLLGVLLAKSHNGDDLLRRMFKRVIRRADEIPETLACYKAMNGHARVHRHSKQMMLGLRDAFHKFDEYQFAKYNRDGDVKLRDALFLTHPGRNDLFDRIAADTLKAAETWEKRLSDAGRQEVESAEQKEENKRGAWEAMITENKMGYMALLRNLRNFLDMKVSPEHLVKVCERLADRDQVLKSKQFPFRFLAAYQELSGNIDARASMILDALEKAVRHSVENIPTFGADDTILIANDVSGSMSGTISKDSKINIMDVGLVLGMMLREKCKAVTTVIFGSSLGVCHMPQGSILGNAVSLRYNAGNIGGSTNGFLVPHFANAQNAEFSKVMIFTDCQMWDDGQDGNGGGHHFRDEWHAYKRKFPKAKLYIFDLKGYGDTPVSIREKDVYHVAGWSEKAFDVFHAIDNGSTIVEEIKNIEL